MKKILILFLLILLIMNTSLATTFENITFSIPTNHYSNGTYNQNGSKQYSIYSNDSTKNIIVQITPSTDKFGYIEFTQEETQAFKDALKYEFVDVMKTTANQSIAEMLGVPLNEAELLGLTIDEYNTLITDYKNSFNLVSYNIENFSEYTALKFIVTSSLFDTTIVQTIYEIPNNSNFYYIIFTGNYSSSEMESFLSTIKINNFVTKTENTLERVQEAGKNGMIKGLLEGITVLIFISAISFVSKIFGKNKKTNSNTSNQPTFITDPSLSYENNLIKNFSEMPFEDLKYLIENKKEEYTEDAYNIALEQYKLRSAINNSIDSSQQYINTPDTENTFNSNDNPITEKKTTF